MARPKKFTEETLARFLPGTFARIKAVLKPREDRSHFIRRAVERALRQRERKALAAAGEKPPRRYHSKIADKIA